VLCSIHYSITYLYNEIYYANGGHQCCDILIDYVYIEDAIAIDVSFTANNINPPMILICRLLKIDSFGLLSKWRKTYWPGNPEKCTPENTNAKIYTLDYFYEVFKFVAPMFLAATIILVVECLLFCATRGMLFCEV
jgi:hypothetical protein